MYRFGGRLSTLLGHSGSRLAQSERMRIQRVEAAEEAGRVWEVWCPHFLSTPEHGYKEKQGCCVRNSRAAVSRPLKWFRPGKETQDTNKAGSEEREC